MNLEKFSPRKLNQEDLAVGASVFLLAAVFAFSAVQAEYQFSETVETDFEVNSSHSLTQASFFNHSVNLMLEDSTDAVFYLDTDMDGSAEEVIGRKSTGRVQRATELVDFEDSVYRLHIHFQDDPEKNGDAWLRVYRVTRFG
jgi:hypothetical protein